jgi:hypothetical protein
MELSFSDEPGRVEGGPEEFVLYDWSCVLATLPQIATPYIIAGLTIVR